MSSLSSGDLADRLNSVAIHILRRLRRTDDASSLVAPELSALSVIVLGGPLTLGALAQAEQVRPPSVTRVVAALERKKLVVREPSPSDGRVVRVRATPAGERLLKEARVRRVAALTEVVAQLPERDRAILARAMPILERLARGAQS